MGLSNLSIFKGIKLVYLFVGFSKKYPCECIKVIASESKKIILWKRFADF